VGWLAAWIINLPAANWLTFDVLRLERGSPLGEAVAFFLYDVPKVLLLLTAAVTVVSFLRSFVSPEKVRRRLAGRGAVPGTVGAAGLGAVTPFCSCSSVPLFIGFVEAGVPLGVTFAFLVASPMVGPVPLILITGLFGPLVAVAYLVTGLSIAVAAGLIIGRLNLERYVEDYVWQVSARRGPSRSQQLSTRRPCPRRLAVDAQHRPPRAAVRRHRHRHRRVIHGYVPSDLVVAVGGQPRTRWPCRHWCCSACRSTRRRGHAAHRRGAAGQGPAAGLGARLHDGRRGPVAARDDHPAAGLKPRLLAVFVPSSPAAS
jgi:hypothetical protein